jgi:hypothetical protein
MMSDESNNRRKIGKFEFMGGKYFYWLGANDKGIYKASLAGGKRIFKSISPSRPSLN